ncbi:MAG: PIG-L family deacetylase [Acidimicrobiales bacterium]
MAASPHQSLGLPAHPLTATPHDRPKRFTVVSFHAHPDDEALFTGGTLARVAAEGHRVVVVVATVGEQGLTAIQHSPSELGMRRLAELKVAAAKLGCRRVHWLGYADSGRNGEVPGNHAFARVDRDLAASRLERILRDERADALTVYDRAGGYGHPDHLSVYDVGHRAAQLAGTPLVLEATVDRSAVLRVARALRLVPNLPREFRARQLENAFSAHNEITHRVDVRPYIDSKRAAMVAHSSQRSGGSNPRSMALYLRLPDPLFRRIFGYEWFIEAGRSPSGLMLDDIFASLRGDDTASGSAAS